MSAEDAMIAALREELEIEFEAASTFVAMHVTEGKFTDDLKLKIYGLFKQATVGPCDTPKPGMFDLKGKAKWSAWKDLGGMVPEEAMVRYIDIVASVYPEWRTMGGGKGGDGGKGPMGPVISTLAGNKEGEEPQAAGGEFYDKSSLSGAASRGDLALLEAALQSGAPVNDRDEGGCCAIHWAADQGHVAAVQLLVKHGADVNARDEMGCTPLHLAVAGDHVEVVRYLASLEETDLDAKDEDGSTAVLQAISEGADDCASAIVEGAKGRKDRLGGREAVDKALKAAEKKKELLEGTIDLLRTLLG